MSRGRPPRFFSGVAALVDRVDYAFSLDFVFHLTERRHDRD
jgi:hypothetical protein